jgi:hypothetical protein
MGPECAIKRPLSIKNNTTDTESSKNKILPDVGTSVEVMRDCDEKKIETLLSCLGRAPKEA